MDDAPDSAPAAGTNRQHLAVGAKDGYIRLQHILQAGVGGVAADGGVDLTADAGDVCPDFPQFRQVSELPALVQDTAYEGCRLGQVGHGLGIFGQTRQGKLACRRLEGGGCLDGDGAEGG